MLRVSNNRFYLSVSVVALTVGGLSACAQVKDTLGLGRQSPDAFMISTYAPLTVPPSYDLPTPDQAASDLQMRQAPRQDALKDVLFEGAGAEAEEYGQTQNVVVETQEKPDETNRFLIGGMTGSQHHGGEIEASSEPVVMKPVMEDVTQDMPAVKKEVVEADPLPATSGALEESLIEAVEHSEAKAEQIGEAEDIIDAAAEAERLRDQGVAVTGPNASREPVEQATEAVTETLPQQPVAVPTVDEPVTEDSAPSEPAEPSVEVVDYAPSITPAEADPVIEITAGEEAKLVADQADQTDQTEQGEPAEQSETAAPVETNAAEALEANEEKVSE